jgi:hypothetical protein
MLPVSDKIGRYQWSLTYWHKNMIHAVGPAVFQGIHEIGLLPTPFKSIPHQGGQLGKNR